MTPYYQDSLITLYNADARAVLPALADGSIDFVFTDPPYGHNNNNGDLIHRREAALGRPPCVENPPLARPIANDGIEANDLIRWAFHEWNRLIGPGCCCCCCCCGGGPDPQFARWSLWLDEAIGFKQMVVWDKGPMGMGWHYRRSYETVLVGEKPGAACRWFDTTDRVENIIRDLSKIIPQKRDHPTPKPVALAEHFIALHTKPGDLVLDCFAGGGSTLQAARNGGRRAIGIEVSEEFCEMTVRGLAQGGLFSDLMGLAMRDADEAAEQYLIENANG
jgi:DNA modification methylase